MDKKRIIISVIIMSILFVALLTVVGFASGLFGGRGLPRSLSMIDLDDDPSDHFVSEDGLFGYFPKASLNQSLPWGSSIDKSQKNLLFKFYEDDYRQRGDITICNIENVLVTKINCNRLNRTYKMYTDMELTYEKDSLEKISFISSFWEQTNRLLIDKDGNSMPEPTAEEIDAEMEIFWPEVYYTFIKFLGTTNEVSETEHFWRRENTELRLKLDTEAKELIITLSRIPQ